MALLAETNEGVIGVSLIKLLGKVCGKEVGFLINIGATLAFINPATAARLHSDVSNIAFFEETITGVEKIV